MAEKNLVHQKQTNEQTKNPSDSLEFVDPWIKKKYHKKVYQPV